MSTKKSAPAQVKAPTNLSISHCNFTSKPSKATVAAVVAIANAAAENAKALQAAASMLRAPDSLLKVQQ